MIRRKTGYTLIEVMIVLTIMVVLASLSLPLMSKSLESYRIRKAGDILRAEWTNLRLQAMEDGQILCFRGMIGGNLILIDRVLDVHFSAGLRTYNDTQSLRNSEIAGTPEYYEKDMFSEYGFTGSEEDFILRDPSLASKESGSRFVTLPEGVFFSDVLAVPDERAAYYLGFTVGEDETGMQTDPVSERNTRFGETRASDGTTWSTPVFFFPDGTTSTAAALLKNRNDKCLEVRLRGLTGTASASSMTSPDRYVGELEPSTQGMSQMEMDAYAKEKR
ncbi:MAG: pilus assembly FimT family protein [Thermoguttaceae bacterium]